VRSDRGEGEVQTEPRSSGLGRRSAPCGAVVTSTGIETLERARAVFEAEGADAEEELAATYANLGAAMFQGDPRAALDWHEKAIRVCELGGLLRLQVFELANAASCLQKLEDLKGARRYMGRAEDLAGKVEDPKLTAGMLLQSAFLDVALGELREAEEGARRAVDLAKRESLARELAHAHYLLGDILVKRGQAATARRSLEEAAARFRRLEDKEMVQRLATELAKLKR